MEQPNDSLLDIALDRPTLARAALYRALLAPNQEIRNPESRSRSGAEQTKSIHPRPRRPPQIRRRRRPPLALLTAALHAHLRGDAAAASRALAEAQQIAERGPMPRYLADVHLHRARLVGMTNAEGRMIDWPGIDPKAELAKARTLIEKHGYWRRREELEDAEAAAAAW